MLSVLLLGEPQLLLDGQRLNITRRKSRALLYTLAARAQPLSRDSLLALFWPDLDRASAQQTLRTTLHGLRKSLASAISTDDNHIGLAADADVRRFESALAAPSPDIQSLAATLVLYRGDFLSGFSLPDAPEFDDWVGGERERYRRLAVLGLSALARLHEARRDYAAALDALSRALAFDALQEDLQRDYIRLHYLAGDRAGAIRRYDMLRKLLDEEMGVPPMAETRAVYDAIISDRADDVSGPRSGASLVAQPFPFSPDNHLPAADLPFTGRAGELRSLREMLSARGHVLAIVEGEPGIGKSRLVVEFIRASNALALTGAAHELEHSLPYLPIIEALRSLQSRPDWLALRAEVRAHVPPVWLAQADRLLPELEIADPAMRQTAASPDESRLWEGVSQLLLGLARQHPVVLFIDDLHWADSSTLALLGYLVRRGTAAPLLCLAAARPVAPRSPLAALLQTLTREDRLLRLPLQRLTADDISRIAERLSPAFAVPLAHWLAPASEGNPYVLAELIRHARKNGILLPDGTLNLPAISAAPVVPQTIYSLVESRLARLSESARRVLDAAVAVGRAFDLDVVARAAALSETAAVDAADELRAAGLIIPRRDDPPGRLYRFDHSLTMEVAYREVGEARHRLLHRRVAEAMEMIHRHHTDPVAGLIASHFGEGNVPDRAAPYAFRAGQLAAGLAAWSEAIGFFQQALAAELDDPRCYQTLMALGEARFRLGEMARASEDTRAALTLARAKLGAAEANAARMALGRMLLNQARYAEAIALAQDTLAQADEAFAVEAEILWGTALSLEGADLGAAVEHLRRAEAVSVAQDKLAGLSQIKFELGSIAAQQGDLPRAVALYREVLTVAPAGVEGEQWRVLANNNLAYHLHLMGEEEAMVHGWAALTLAQEIGALGVEPYIYSTLGEIAMAAGDLDVAQQWFAKGLEIAEQLQHPERIAGLTANLGLVAQRRGDTVLAIHRLSTALAHADSLGTRHLAAQIRLWLAPLLPPAEARARLAEARAIAESGGRRRLLAEADRLEAALPRDS